MRELLVGALALGMSVAAASGAVTKITSFAAAGAGTAENPGADGMATINLDTHVGGSRVHLHMEGLQPNEVYGVAIYQTGNDGSAADVVDPLGLTTTPSGQGTYRVTLPTMDLGAYPMIRVFLWDGDLNPDSFLVITEDELRAEGAAP